MQDVQDELKQYPECKVYLSTPPVIPGLGTSGGFEMQLEARGDATYDDLVRATDTLMYYASQRKEFAGLLLRCRLKYLSCISMLTVIKSNCRECRWQMSSLP